MPFIADRVFGWKPVAIDESWDLRSITKGNAYSICSSLYCVDCDFLFLDMRFSDLEMQRLYEDYRGSEYTELREMYEPGYRLKNSEMMLGVGYVDKIENFLKSYLVTSPKILDWGGASGINTPFKKVCKSLDIYDIDKNTSRLNGLTISAEDLSKRQYDLIVLSNVLEHIPYPQEIIEFIKKCLQPNSVFYLEVPFEELMTKGLHKPHLLKKHWHEHINFFSENSLVNLIKRCGLDIISTDVISDSAGGSSSLIFQMACRLR
jgi:hypothetical protein